MGYALGLWAASVDGLENRLRRATGDTADTDADADTDAADGTGERTATPEEADAVALWLDQAGEQVGSVDHSSSAGEWFRTEIIGGPVTARFGADLAGHLISRPLAGLDWEDYPTFGWATNAELRAAVPDAAAGTGDAEPTTDAEEILLSITEALVEVRDSGKDLVTYYA